MAGVATFDSRYDDSDNEIDQEIRALEAADEFRDEFDGSLTLNGERVMIIQSKKSR